MLGWLCQGGGRERGREETDGYLGVPADVSSNAPHLKRTSSPTKSMQYVETESVAKDHASV